jgi:protein SCO1/2
VRQSAFRLIAAAALALTAPVVSAAAEPVDRRSVPPDEDRLLYGVVPDVTLSTSAGRTVKLLDLAGGRPLLLTFVFTRCPGVCSPFLRSWRAADRSTSDYVRVVVSFDPRDTAPDMATLADHLALNEVERDTWTFAVAERDDVRRLADATGFWWDWDESRQTFDHPAMIAAVRDGRLIRLLVGGSITSARLDELVREASGAFVASYPLPGRVRFRCVEFDAATGRVTLSWGFAVLLLPPLCTIMATAIVFATGSRVRERDVRPRHLRRVRL